MKSKILLFLDDYCEIIVMIVVSLLVIFVFGLSIRFILYDKCSVCDTLLSVRLDYCTSCGHDMKNHCDICGSENSASAKYCADCGNEL